MLITATGTESASNLRLGPSNFPTDAHGLASFDGEQIYAYKNLKERVS
ncbi:MAG: hypothetical protein IPH77_19695 [Ignavibacteria bacterium]|nr:hypothetical protein [Ignavibacteria bacterium]